MFVIITTFCVGQLPPLTGSTLVPFANRDIELERRILLLKRISFVVLCGEIDQYVRAMPDIQGK